jgi:Flp pilus assembly protein CpaB
VNEVIGVAGYVLPGTRVDVVGTLSPTRDQIDVTSKVILTNVLVLAAGTKIEQDEKNKPIQVTVVTLLVNPEEAEKVTLASTEGKIQLALPQSSRQDGTSDLRHQAGGAHGHRRSRSRESLQRRPDAGRRRRSPQRPRRPQRLK